MSFSIYWLLIAAPPSRSLPSILYKREHQAYMVLLALDSQGLAIIRIASGLVSSNLSSFMLEDLNDFGVQRAKMPLLRLEL